MPLNVPNAYRRRRQEIVEAAMHAFARRGYAGATIADIAHEADVSQPRISQIFGGKERAFVAAHQLATSVVVDELRSRARQPFDPVELGGGYLDLLRTNPQVLMMMMHGFSAASLEESIGVEVRRSMNEVLDVLIEDAGASYPEAVRFLETGFAIHHMLAAGVLEHVDASPHFRPLLAASPYFHAFQASASPTQN